MLIEHMACGSHPHKYSPAVPIVENAANIIQCAPSGDHVIFVAIVFDVRDAPLTVLPFRRRWIILKSVGKGDEWIVEV